MTLLITPRALLMPRRLYHHHAMPEVFLPRLRICCHACYAMPPVFASMPRRFQPPLLDAR